jgi:hypoxanthine phosphoribosyltransferase
MHEHRQHDTWPAFAHASEEEFAHFLDFYQVEWRYEPACFVLERDDEGRVTESFTPDFYLPQFNLYVELTTMKQRLVTRKNRKLRRMKALYPDVRVKILYGRDFRKLLFRFGYPSE